MPANFPIIFKVSYLLAILPTIFVVITAMLSSKEVGGTLGQGLKKISAGSIIHTILIMTYIVLERGNRGLLEESVIKIFFIIGGGLGSGLFTWGYLQIYKIARKLKLFTI
ncbi:hypothetical protein COU97_00560 [Candidatus Shapirobacteria bacterium CG10_big_fil_rev_8_21_14_0_10_48_15]|uniref:Uncharacterized protein n=1 Tax=Candidatus Shapirobacteria bacterium CG10_big_fil_rev_8_21_14_0_10_48_15 TaxID=1974484 RepID=A0A2M8L7Q1_9BACT|nr:MAG: hypothetical protein COU97_00560 [Candidatus Shapirobacteria bacterium CG10_big_fil_rev_8_21_14_0_10_48_15]